MKNTKSIQLALGKLCSDMGSQRAVAAKVRVANSTVGDWLSGKATRIRVAHWTKLQPLLAAYMPSAALDTTDDGELIEAGPCKCKADIDPLCREILEQWDELDPLAQNEILRIISKYRRQ